MPRQKVKPASQSGFSRVMEGLEEAVAYAEGAADRSSYRVHVPDEVDVRAVRARRKLTQKEFAAAYGFSLGALRDWEQGRKRPEASARILLKVIDKHPEAVDDVLAG